MKCVVESKNNAVLVGPFPVPFLQTIARLAGGKTWLSSATVEIVRNDHNLNLLAAQGVEIEYKTPVVTDDILLGNREATAWKYRPAMELRAFQKECLQRSWNKPNFAIFAEMGLGKTAIQIANIGVLATLGEITGVLIVAPNGVHSQWIENEFPKHADPRFEYIPHIWEGNPKKLKFGLGKAHCEVLSMNVDALRLKRVKRKTVRVSQGLTTAEDFLDMHKGKCMIIVDESHLIKDYSSQRTKAIWALGRLAQYKRIMTGTPIAKNLVDMWAQFNFLDPNIIGYKSLVAFRSHYCIMGGYEEHEIVGTQNIEEFYSVIAPYTYRKTKKEVTDLPDKVYAQRTYEMSDETKRHYLNMKRMWLTRLDNGEIKDAPNALVSFLRLQQILCGFLEHEDGTIQLIGMGERLDALLEIIKQTEGPTIIWARFTRDIELIAEQLRLTYGERSCVTYDGTTTDAERKEAKRAFTNRECRFFIGNVGISAGLDGLQVASNMVFYSCDFNAVHRWQSEDRAHRFGMQESLTIFDIVARKSIDYSILGNLSKKKSLSDLTLDQIRQALLDS